MAEVSQNLVGSRVRKLRTALGVSQEAFAAKCQTVGWDLSRGTFSKIEAGLRRVNDAEVLLLAKVLKCSISDLMDGHPIAAVRTVARHGDTAG